MSTDVLDRNKIRVGILRGGPSNEYDVSLRTGDNVIKSLPEKYLATDILISKEGEWHTGGFRREPVSVLSQVDVIFNALHGKYGEDGKVQKLLETYGVPFTGSASLPSSLAISKAASRKILSGYSIKFPVHIVLTHKDNTFRRLSEVFRSFLLPSVIKPVSSGSSLGVSLATDLQSFLKGVEVAFRHSPNVIVEEYLKGREATCGVLESEVKGGFYSLPPVEIIVPPGSLFSLELKYGGGAKEICPGRFDNEEKEQIQDLAIAVHRALGLRHYSHSDFIIVPRRGIYLLEVNALPGLTEASLFPKALSAASLSMGDFLDHTLGLALNNL